MTMTWRAPVSILLGLLLAACGSQAVGNSSDSAATQDTTSSPHYLCTQVMGVSVTGDWFSGGFETAVDDGRWQAVTLAHAYVDLWADATNTVWDTPVVSPCTQHADNPDRVLFTGVNWTYTTTAEWTTALKTVVANLKAKYSNLKHIELLTMLRSPGNKPCPDSVNQETVVQPVVDEAIAQVVAAYPGFVTAAPKFEAPNCDVFLLGGPHFMPDGQAAVATVDSAYSGKEP